jgi:hypothetical protein
MVEQVGVRLAVEDARTFSRVMHGAASDVRGVGSAADDVRGNFRRMESDVDRHSRKAFGGFKTLGLGAVAAVGAAVGGLAVGAFSQLSAGFKEFGERQALNAETSRTLKTMGTNAGVTAGDIQKLADARERLTGVEAESFQAGANTLLTFDAIRNRVGKAPQLFDRAAKAAQDMSVRLGTDATSAATQLGKALQDPAKGATALSRNGTILRDDVAKLNKMNKEGVPIWKQQQFLLRAVEKQYGGAAKTFGSTLPGQMAKMRNAFGDIREGAAEALMPLAQRLIPALTTAFRNFAPKVATWIREDLLPAIDKFGAWWDRNGPGVTAVAKALFKTMATNIRLVWEGSKLLFRGIDLGVDVFLNFAKHGVGMARTVLNGFLTMVEGVLRAGASIPGPLGEQFRKAEGKVAEFRDGANAKLDQIDRNITMAIDDRQARRDLEAFRQTLEATTHGSWDVELAVRGGNAAALPSGGGGGRRRRGGKGGADNKSLSVPSLTRPTGGAFVRAGDTVSVDMSGWVLQGVTPETAEDIARKVDQAVSKHVRHR